MRPSTPLDDKYELLEKLHEGGMGAIYRARHRLLGEDRVIKVIRSEHRSDGDLGARFIDEARAAVRLRHPNITQLYDFGIAPNGTAYMVLELIEGVNLEELLRSTGPPSVGLAVEIASQTLSALDYIHRGFVHRDISPDNLMLTRAVDDGPLVKLIDLGIAKPLGTELDLSRAAASTRRGSFLGKARYASPEQLQGTARLDGCSDLYSLGIVLYQLLTNAFPIRGTDMRSLLAGHLFEGPRPFEETDSGGRVPAELRRIVLKALEKRPEDRFASAREFQQELGRAWTPQVSTAELEAILRHAARATGPSETDAARLAEETTKLFAAPEDLASGAHDGGTRFLDPERAVADRATAIEMLLEEGELEKARKLLDHGIAELGEHETLASLRRVLELRAQATDRS